MLGGRANSLGFMCVSGCANAVQMCESYSQNLWIDLCMPDGNFSA